MSRLILKSGLYLFEAILEEKNAPLTCAKVLSMLPIMERVVHVRWSGEGIWIPYGDMQMNLPYENPTSYAGRGMALLYPGGVSEAEIVFAYGDFCFASKAGQLAGNHFLTITSQLDKFYEFGRQVLYEGAQELIIELAK